jgi:hypothetical protein
VAICAVVSLFAYRAETAQTVVVFVSVAACCGYANGVTAYAIAITLGGKRVAIVFATMNMAGNVGAGLFPYAVGKLADRTLEVAQLQG